MGVGTEHVLPDGRPHRPRGGGKAVQSEAFRRACVASVPEAVKQEYMHREAELKAGLLRAAALQAHEGDMVCGRDGASAQQESAS